MTTPLPLVPLQVEPGDPEYMSHAQYEVQHPRRAEMARQYEDRRRAEHQALHPDDEYEPRRQFPCQGRLRITDRDQLIWTLQCDACGTRYGLPRVKADTELLIANRLRHSRIPMQLATKQLQKTAGNEAARAVLRILTERWGTDLEPHPPLLIGATGRGKTHMLAMAAHQLVKRHLAQVHYWAFADLLAAARRRMDADGEGADEFLEREMGVQLLVLDDLGAEHTTGWGAEVLQRIVDHRERLGLRLMGATNIADDEWDLTWGARTASRLRGMTTAVEVHGDDFREKANTPSAGAAGNVVPLRPNAPGDSSDTPAW